MPILQTELPGGLADARGLGNTAADWECPLLLTTAGFVIVGVGR